MSSGGGNGAGSGISASVLLNRTQAGKVPILNWESGKCKFISPDRLMFILDKIGRDFQNVDRVLLINNDAPAMPYPIPENTLILQDKNENLLIWKEAQKKGPESYPPLSPREMANLFLKMVNTEDCGTYNQMLIELDQTVNKWRELDDARSVRYLQNAIGALSGAAEMGRMDRTVFKEQRQMVGADFKLQQERENKITDDEVKQMADDASSRKKKLDDRLDLTNTGTVLRYVIPSLVTTGFAVYNTVVGWMASWPAWGKSAVIGGTLFLLSGAVWGYRAFVHHQIDKASSTQREESKRLRDESLERQKKLLFENGEHMVQMAQKWNDLVHRQAQQVAIKIFNIAMDFYEGYVRRELKEMGADWSGKSLKGAGREEALKVLADGLARQQPALYYKETETKMLEEAK